MELNQSNENVFSPWNYPTKPSARARKLIEELNRQGREDFNVCGPSVEYRDGVYWIDISYQRMTIDGKLLKFAIEIDEAHHNDPIQKQKDFWKDHYLKSKGWMIKRIHHEDFDAKNVGDLAWEILFEIRTLCDFPSGEFS